MLLRGALVEYSGGPLGPIPNVVIFQFNPESLARTLQIPQRPTGATQRETTQAGEKTFETITFKAHFSAADMLGEGKALAQLFGIGPQLAALEKMVSPSAKIAGAIGAAIDAIGDALGLGGGDDAPAQPIPRETYPRILFIWGPSRVLPVTIDSMSISELEYDAILNPLRAEVDITLSNLRKKFLFVLGLLVIAVFIILPYFIEYLEQIKQVSKKNPGVAFKKSMFVLKATLGFVSFLLVMTGIYSMSLARRTLKSGQYPPPDMSVIRDTSLRRRTQAKRAGILLIALSWIVIIFACFFLYWPYAFEKTVSKKKSSDTKRNISEKEGPIIEGERR